MTGPVQAGDVFTAERTFTESDVESFTELSRDRGRHHLGQAGGGRRMVQGLLVASLATEIGGQIHYIAREMVLEFLRPVYAGDRVQARIVVTEAVKEEGRTRLAMTVLMTNEQGKEVMRGTSRGLVLDRDR